MRATGFPSVAIHTLGCKVNQCDTNALLERLTEAGLLIREFNQMVDIYIINTCTVTQAGDKKSLQIIRRARKLNPEAFVAVCGCMPQSQSNNADKIMAAGADFIFDTRKPDDLLTKLGEIFVQMNTISLVSLPIHSHSERTRAFIKIQDGCNRYCNYCIVPYVRGPVVSRPITEILEEAATHIQRGMQEIVLTGIQVAAYGYATGSEVITLPGIIKQLSGLGLKRLRLSSIDPWAVDDEFLAAVGETPTLCSHFHLSLQSGSDKTLARMNRRYTTTAYAHAVERLKKLRPDVALTTDIIVGFPGESDADFDESVRFAKEIGFTKIHVFEYSPRVGTPAADFPNQVLSKIKSARGEEMRTLAKSLEHRFWHSQVGKLVPALFEVKTRNSSKLHDLGGTGIWQGYTDNYCLVKAQGTNLANKLEYVQITGITEDGLIGELKPNVF